MSLPRTDKPKAVTYRLSEKCRKQLAAIARSLGRERGRPVSLGEVVEIAVNRLAGDQMLKDLAGK